MAAMATPAHQKGELMYMGMLMWGEAIVAVEADRIDVFSSASAKTPSFTIAPMSDVSVLTTGKCEGMAPTGLPAGSAFEVKYGSKSTFFFAMSTYERSKWVNCIEHNVVLANGGYAAKKQREKEAAEAAREREVEAAKEQEVVDEKNLVLLKNALKYKRKPTKMEGELIKEAESFFALGAWNERWVVLDKREFKYYKYKGAKEPAYVIPDVRKMKLVKTGACEKKFPTGTEAGTCFEIQDHGVSPVKSMFFFAMGKLELTKWTAAIENNIQLYEIGYGNEKMMKAATKTKPELKIKDLIDFPKVNEKIASYSAKELKKRLKELKIDLSGCLDKHDFVEKAKLCVPIVIDASLDFMSLKTMKDLLQEASEQSEGEVSAAGCLERSDFVRKLTEECILRM